MNMKLGRAGIHWRKYIFGLCLVVAGTILGHLVQTFFDPTNIIMIYLLCVTVSAVFWGLGPSVFVAVAGVLTFDFFFVPPHHTLAVDDTQYLFTFIALLVVGVIISYLTSRTRRQTEEAIRKEKETSALYTLGHDLAIASSLDSYIKAITRRVRETFGYDVIVFLPDEKNTRNIRPYTDTPDISIDNTDFTEALSTLRRFSENKQDINLQQHSKSQYLPLVTARGIIGIMTLKNPGSPIELTSEQEQLLKAYIDLAAVAIEGIILADQARYAQVIQETEKLQNALLNAISHDLKTPLVSVIGVLSSLQEEGMHLDENAKENLIQVAREEADKLNHLISNLLDESRIEAGAIKITKQPVEIQDLVGSALEQLGARAKRHRFKIEIPPELPFVYVDVGLIVQALVNVIDNALKYSPQDTPIEIKAQTVDEQLQIEIIDMGVGIPPQDIDRIFDKFYRIQRPDNVSGTGMGLSISKGIIEAHGGYIEANNHPGGGTVIRISLSSDKTPFNERKFTE